MIPFSLLNKTEACNFIKVERFFSFTLLSRLFSNMPSHWFGLKKCKEILTMTVLTSLSEFTIFNHHLMPQILWNIFFYTRILASSSLGGSYCKVSLKLWRWLLQNQKWPDSVISGNMLEKSLNFQRFLIQISFIIL